MRINLRMQLRCKLENTQKDIQSLQIIMTGAMVIGHYSYGSASAAIED